MKKALVLLLVLALMLTGFYGKAKGINSPVTVTAYPNTAGSYATFTITFTMINLVPASTGWITLTFPLGFTVPSGPINTSYVTVQAGGFISLVSVTGSGQQITIVPSVLMNSGPVYISISNLAYIRNPAAGGTYPNFLVANSTGEPAGTGSIIIQSAVQNVNVLVNPLNAGSVADYTI